MMVLVIDVLQKMVNAMRLCRGESQNEQHRKRERGTARQPTASTEGVHCRCTRFLPDVAGQRKRTRFRLMCSRWRTSWSSDRRKPNGDTRIEVNSPTNQFYAFIRLMRRWTKPLRGGSVLETLPAFDLAFLNRPKTALKLRHQSPWRFQGLVKGQP